MSNFLTIDLDYFTMTRSTNAIPFLLEWMKKAPDVYLIDTHEKLVEQNLIPKETTKIFNVDFHNDITIQYHPDYKELDLNEGTWGNFLNKNVKEFVWMYPSKEKCVIHELFSNPQSLPDGVG
jgi:hypothetical protein